MALVFSGGGHRVLAAALFLVVVDGRCGRAAADHHHGRGADRCPSRSAATRPTPAGRLLRRRARTVLTRLLIRLACAHGLTHRLTHRLTHGFTHGDHPYLLARSGALRPDIRAQLRPGTLKGR
ncbi:hypothetical protein Slala05_04840 [Streptomyces lavendulae subsp. lavendulae]|nr:hypothetical protein Slala05_04840 [Streptomyces lavendulae subsp. lavendulae]